MHKSFFIKTYGCQMNNYDSEKINDLLVSNGFEKTDDVVFSTSSVFSKPFETTKSLIFSES